MFHNCFGLHEQQGAEPLDYFMDITRTNQLGLFPEFHFGHLVPSAELTEQLVGFGCKTTLNCFRTIPSLKDFNIGG